MTVLELVDVTRVSEGVVKCASRRSARPDVTSCIVIELSRLAFYFYNAVRSFFTESRRCCSKKQSALHIKKYFNLEKMTVSDRNLAFNIDFTTPKTFAVT